MWAVAGESDFCRHEKDEEEAWRGRWGGRVYGEEHEMITVGGAVV